MSSLPLFPTDSRCGAIIEGVYRYRLWRPGYIRPPHIADAVSDARGGWRLLFVMFNPSKADALDDDPTLRQCIAFARRWGFERLDVVNLYALRATDPKTIARNADPIGAHNDRHLVDAVGRADRVVLAWGAANKAGQSFAVSVEQRARAVCEIIRAVQGERSIVCLGVCDDGQPRHPLRLAHTTEAIPWAT